MAVKFGNNAATLLASNASSSTTALTVVDGSVFPTLSGSDYTYITLEDVDANREIVKLTARSGNTLTVVRAQDGSSARAFSAADKCELRITAALLNDLNTDADTESVSISGDTMTGALLGTTASFSGSVTAASVVVSGNVDGRDVATDGTKLDGIEASATADQTNAEIRTAVEAASDSNVFTDADHTKLNAIEASATADQTAAEIRALVESATDSNVFTDADHTKLNAVEASADVTANAGALMDSELTAIASVKALNQGVATTDSPTFSNLTLSGTASVKVPSGTTAQRDGTPANGMFRYNSTNEQFEGYQSSAWGAIGGGGGSNTFTTDTFTGNGTVTAYALSQVINSENNLMVFIGGVFQQQSAYSITTASGVTTLTFSEAPANTREIVIYSIAGAVSGSNLNNDQFTANGSTTAFTLSIAPVHEANTMVFIDGVYQQKTDYAVSGTTLTFDAAPANSSVVEVSTFTQTDINVPVDNSVTTAILVDGSVTSAKIASDVALAGNPTAATQATGNTTTRLATTAFVQQEVTALVDSSPSTLDTLNELAAALGDDPNFATTTATSIGTKLSLSGGTLTGTLSLGDNVKAQFGASNDLQIYHDGSHSYVGDYGTGNLSVTGNNLYLQNTAGETYFSGISDGAVSLYHNNLAKLATTSTGIDVTGTATMDGLLVGGNLDITSEYPRINLTDTNSNPDWSIINANGIINFYDQTNATNPLKVKATGIDVTGAVNSTGEMRITNPSATSQLYLYGAAGQKANIILNEYGVRAWHLGAGTYTSGNFSISDGSTERLVINSSGFVGIGADPLNAKVDIARESDYTSHTGHGLAIHSSGNTAYTSLYVGTDDTIDCAYIQTAGRNTSFTSKSLLLNPNGGNVLVGKTAANFTVAGHEIKPNSFAGFTRDGGAPVVVNRLTNDGALVEFYRGTQSVGSVGSRIGTGITIDSGGSTDGLLKNNGAESFGWNANYFYPRTDNSKDLGLDVLRWKDLYLSGGVYLGGTGAANKLDDFESGTWFPNFDEQTAGTGTYTKVGRLVTVQGQVTCDANGGATGALAMSGLPFSVGVSNSLRLIVSMTNVNASAGGSGVASPFNGMTFNMHDQYVRATSTGGNPYYSYNLLKIGTVVRISGSFVTS